MHADIEGCVEGICVCAVEGDIEGCVKGVWRVCVQWRETLKEPVFWKSSHLKNSL